MKLPIGIQDFEKIRTGGYLYIDKTEMKKFYFQTSLVLVKAPLFHVISLL
jgi:hypothetical protein